MQGTSIIGTRVLQRMGVPNVWGLKNGTAGWMLAGEKLESGADRVTLPEPSPPARAPLARALVAGRGG